MIKKCYIISFTVLFSLVSEAQILDDSTKQVYNQNTTFYFHEKDVIDGELNQYNPDTSINFVHRYNWQTINNNLYQDLGNLGSALFPVFYKARTNIGTNYGINIYDEYFESPDEVRYFNTRSPFTELKYVQGANNFSNLKAEFSRNIGPYFNSTFKVDRFTSDKSLANVGRDRLVEHWSFIYNTNYRSKNGRYKVLYHYSHLSHEVEEQGGIRPLLSDRIPEDLYLYQSANVWLNDAFTWERRNNHHLYQHFKILRDSTSDFRLFHEFDRVNIKDRFTDNSLANTDTFYNFTYYQSIDNTLFTTQYSLYENKMGLGGSFKQGFFYRGYMRHRYFYSNFSNEWNTELFVGGVLRKKINSAIDSLDIRISGESQLPGDYRIGLNISGKKFNVVLSRIYYSPDIVQNRFNSNHFIWNNDFNRTLSDNLNASYRFRIGQQTFKPFVNFHRINNYIYYDQFAQARQTTKENAIVYAGIETSLKFWKLNFSGLVQYGKSGGPDVFRFPELFSKAILYFESRITRGKSSIQFGIEAFYRSAYYGNAYMPANFQFHLQDEFRLDQTIVPDVFASFQFRQAQAFVKVPYFIQGWAVPGYFSSPYYTGVQRPDAVSLGFRWQFYD
ncbi:hypothetical protein HZR84_02410 [Hyphobacterium sp. CCMP332]|nr:hypothetical protein HZR84_02410 [Hyphobacterium sp. CCMP332]